MTYGSENASGNWGQVRNIVGSTVKDGATITVSGPRMSATVVDNGQGDADPTWGKLKLFNLQPGTFTLCETVAPVGYATALPACLQTEVVANAVATLQFVHVTLPYAQFQVRNLVSNKLIGGSTFITHSQ